MVNLFQSHGAQPSKPPKFTAIFIDRAFTGLYTQRAVLHDPSDVYTARYYGGRPDALLGGRNVELTNRLTLQRRPGHILFGGGAVYPTSPLRAFSFQLANGSIQVIIDTGTSGSLTITSCNNASGSTTVYNGTFPGGASNGLVGLIFQIAGFPTNTQNNGTFTCTASTATALTLSNTAGVAETRAATAVSAGGVFVDNQNGTSTLLFGKGVGAGQTQFVASAGVLYMGDGVEVKKYTPLNTNGTVWNWGIATPVNPPTVNVTQSGAASTVWQASTVFSTMGLTKDTNATPQIWQLIGVNADATNPTSQFGTSGNGEPNWNSATVEGQTVVDNTVTWQNAGAVSEWLSNGFYTDMGWFGNSPAPNFTQPAFANTSDLKTLYGNFKNSGSLGQTSTTRPPFNGAYPGPSAGYFANNTHFFAIGQYQTTAGMQAMRWKQSTVYTGWQAGGVNNTTVNGAPGFILTGNLPAPTGTKVYLFIPTVGGTSGSGYIPFPANSAIGYTQGDKQLLWLCLGQAAWQASHVYIPWQTHNVAFGCVHDGANFQVCKSVTGAGLSGARQPGTALATAVSITASISGQQTTYTLGAGSWSFTPSAGDQISVSGFVNAGNNTQNNSTFTIFSATSNTIIVTNPGGVNETHSATITFNPWGTGYGTTTTDNNITWVCVGPNVAWAAAQTWHLPPNGFQPPSSSQGFGGSLVNDTNNNVQAVISSGTSGGSQPTWKLLTDKPPTTTDNTITWQAIAAVQTQSLAISFGLAWAYSYKARSVIDSYSPAPTGGGLTPPGSVFLGSPIGSGTNAISTASPFLQITGANTGAVFTLTGDYSSDPQVDTIVIWRSADSASGSGAMFELTEIPNVPSLAGVKKWIFRDFLPSVANGTFPGLNILLPAPINGVNNPPATSFLPMVYNFQRIWGANGQVVPFSGGPDTSVGNPNEAFLGADNLPFLAPVIRLVRTSQGIVTFLTDSVEMIGGGPQTSSFFSVTMSPGIGLGSYNACDVFAGEIYFFATDNSFRVITPSLNIASFGFPIGDQLANQPAFGSSDTTWDPTKVYVAVLQNGIDNCIMLGDGSTGWYRLNPHQVPGGLQGPEPVWSPFAAITGGAKMMQAVEIAPGQKRLLVGGTSAGSQILQRSTTVYTDNGTQYDGFFTMGSLTLAHPGQIALLRFLEFDFSGVGYQPTVSYLLNEISGSFTPFVNGALGVPQSDPPEVYGATKSPTSYSPNRYYFAANPVIARCRHMQIKVDFGTTANGDEVYSMTIFGRYKNE